MKISTVIVIAALFALVFGAGEPAKYLTIGIGAEHIGRGCAGTADRNSVFAPFYNPALLSARGKPSIGFGNLFLGLGRRMYYAAFATQIRDEAGVGVVWVHSSVADVERRDIDGNITGKVNNNNDAVYFSFAKEAYGGLHAGLGVQYVQSNIENLNAYSAGLAGGIFCELKKYGIIVGASATNISLELKWNSSDYYDDGRTSRDKLPLFWRFGGEKRGTVKSVNYKFDADIFLIGDRELSYSIGAECSPHESFVVTLGVRDGRFSAGFGLNIKLGFFKRLSFGYAISAQPYGVPPMHVVEIRFDLK